MELNAAYNALEDNSDEIQETVLNMAYNTITSTTDRPQSVRNSMQSDIDWGYTEVRKNRGEHFTTKRNYKALDQIKEQQHTIINSVQLLDIKNESPEPQKHKKVKWDVLNGALLHS